METIEATRDVIDVPAVAPSTLPAVVAGAAAPASFEQAAMRAVEPQVINITPQELKGEGFEFSSNWPLMIPALVAAQAAFGSVEKNKRAQVQSRREGAASYTYGYADLAAVLDATREHLNANGVFFTQLPAFKDNDIIITTILAHASGATMKHTIRFRMPGGTDVQGHGSGITYLRRYSSLSILGLAPEEGDNDGKGALPKRDARPEPERRPSNVTRMPDRPAPPASPAADTGTLVSIAQLEKRESDGRPFWIVEFSDKRQAVTTRQAFGDVLEKAKKDNRAFSDVSLLTRPGKSPAIEELVLAPEVR